MRPPNVGDAQGTADSIAPRDLSAPGSRRLFGAGARLRSGALSAPGTLAPAVYAALAVAFIASDEGGYFPTSWGWSALALTAVATTWLVAEARTDLGRLDVAFQAALTLMVAWVGLSILWSSDRAQSIAALERSLVLLTGCASFLVLARRRGARLLTAGLMLAITGVSAYALWNRLFPTASTFHPRDPITLYRLFEPVGYWNALGAFAAVGILLALGVLNEPSGDLPTRIAAAVSIVVLPVTLFFTFSRGAWFALACGLAFSIAVFPRRFHLVATAATFAVLPAVGVLLASRSPALTATDARLPAAVHEGKHLAADLVALAVASAALAPVHGWISARVRLGLQTRRGFAAALVVALAAAGSAAVVHEGGPAAIARRGYHSFIAPTPLTLPVNQSNRLFSLNGDGRARMWSVALHTIPGHWLGGTGAGSFARTWRQSPRADESIQDAHSLYVQTLSELGIVGLALVVGLLVIPFLALRRLRWNPAAVGPAGAYAVFVLHNGVDWDWQLSGVALTGLLVGALLLVLSRDRHPRAAGTGIRAGGAVMATAVAAFALVAAIGNGALARAQSADASHRYATAAADANTARSWMPWSPEPLKALGEAQLRLGEVSAARATFTKATAVDPRDWQAWLDLAASVEGRARRRAVARARALYPTSPEVTEFVKETRTR